VHSNKEIAQNDGDNSFIRRDSKVKKNSEIPKPLVGDCEYVTKKKNG
jgi:hypothetical protein